MPRYLLHHRHPPEDCGIAYAAFKGEDTPLRRRTTLASCLTGGHDIWWVAEADSAEAALAQLPHYLATRSTATPVTEVQIP
jgi:hypothetical protein